MACPRIVKYCLAISIFAFLFSAQFKLSVQAEAPLCLRLAIPAYAYPTVANNFWNASSGMPKGAIYVLNPASGPGVKVDPTYKTAISRAEKSGVVIFGYVDTDYGRRPDKAILADVNQFHKLYPSIKGVFLDQTQLDAVHFSYYKGISQNIRAEKLKLAFNPGQPIVDQRYVALADHIMTFEGPLSTYLKTSFPKWQNNYPKSKFWHLVYEASDEGKMRQVVQKAKALPAGLLYITNRGMPNPWDALPPYWRDEIKQLCPMATNSRTPGNNR